MDEEKLIQVSFQIPPSALDSLSRLAEQLRLLTEATGIQAASSGKAAEHERGESDSFDTERFQALRQGLNAQAGTAAADVSDIGEARAVSSTMSQTGNAEPVSANVQKELQDARDAGETLSHQPEKPAREDALHNLQRTLLEERDTPPPPAEAVQPGPAGSIPTVQAGAEASVPDAQEAQRDVERQVLEMESARTEAEERELALAAARGEVSGGIEAPLGAGVVIQTQPEMPQSRWSGVTEELVIPGPAPLTAEAVSLAFERDGRRYDNGFPLY